MNNLQEMLIIPVLACSHVELMHKSLLNIIFLILSKLHEKWNFHENFWHDWSRIVTGAGKKGGCGSINVIKSLLLILVTIKQVWDLHHISHFWNVKEQWRIDIKVKLLGVISLYNYSAWLMYMAFTFIFHRT